MERLTSQRSPSMSAAIDTQKLAHRFHEVGFSKKQATGTAEILAELLDDRAPKDETAAALALIAAKVDAVDHRVTELRTEVRADISEVRADIGELRTDVNDLKAGQARMEALLSKLVDGQAVLLQNDMELKRRLDER